MILSVSLERKGRFCMKVTIVIYTINLSLFDPLQLYSFFLREFSFQKNKTYIISYIDFFPVIASSLMFLSVDTKEKNSKFECHGHQKTTIRQKNKRKTKVDTFKISILLQEKKIITLNDQYVARAQIKERNLMN